MRTISPIAAVAAAVLLTGLAGAATAGTSAATPSGRVAVTSGTAGAGRAVPAAFRNPRQNPYFPLRPGTVSRYRGSADGERYVETVTVTRRHRVISGVPTTVVRDVVRRTDGTLAERTTDWYAPDRHGTVWYFGERTATFDERGRLESREGSWRDGVAGARRGVVMPAHPRPTDAYRQELRVGHAEDQAWIVQRGLRVRVPYGRVRQAIRSLEWTRLEPGVVSAKIYAPGLGIVRERDLAGGDERFELVSVSRPR